MVRLKSQLKQLKMSRSTSAHVAGVGRDNFEVFLPHNQAQSGVWITVYGLTVSVSSCVASVLFGCAVACRHLTMIV